MQSHTGAMPRRIDQEGNNLNPLTYIIIDFKELKNIYKIRNKNITKTLYVILLNVLLRIQ